MCSCFLCLQFAIETGLTEQPFHILGTSLGGAISAVYSAMYPEDVAKATLVCPASRTFITSNFYITKYTLIESQMYGL